jgi:type VI secretion system protein ImpF
LTHNDIRVEIMAIRPDQPLVPSVLDRLLDDDPGVTTEPPRNRSQMLREMKLAVRRDIENLLNTRRRNISIPARLPELSPSLLSYGVADFSGTGPTTAKQRDAFCRSLEELLRANEPRLLEVRVELISNTEPGDRTFRFRIDALLRADPAPEPVIFDSALEPVTQTFSVKS